MNKEKIEDLVKQIIEEGLGLDIYNPNLLRTPERIARMFCEEFFFSVGEEPSSKELAVFPNEGFDEIIMFDNIPFTSTCIHHFLPFSGLAWFLYIPDKHLIGASKPTRIIEFFSKMPQLQERLSVEVMEFFLEGVKPKGAMLVMRAIHSCMSCRGVKTGLGSGMITSVTSGAFRENIDTRQEGLDLVRLSVMLKGLV